ncbi:MAG: YegS/Rv2252/BmrU family lipid kinase [Actinomycetota bacterium]
MDLQRFTQASFREDLHELEKATGKHQRYLVVVNPVSRGGKAMREGVWLVKHLSRLGVSHEAFFTDYPGHARNIVKRWIDSVDVVVAVGGDGTVNEVINGVMASGSDKPLAVFPAGTADDFCHNIGISRDRKKALEVLLTDSSRPIDLMRYNDRYAAVTLGIGVDAEIVYHTLSHKRIRIPAYFAVGLRTVFIERMRKSPRELRVESETGVLEGRFLIAVFGNAPLYGRYVYWLPEALMDDGVLDMSALRPMKPIAAWSLLMKCFNKEFRSEKIIHDRSTWFKVEILEESFMQVDGEVYKVNAGERLDISVERKALNVRLPFQLPADSGLSGEKTGPPAW